MDTYTQNNGACACGRQVLGRTWSQDGGPVRQAGCPLTASAAPACLPRTGVDWVDFCSCIDLGLAHERGLVGWVLCLAPAYLSKVPCPALPAIFLPLGPLPLRPCSRTILERHGTCSREPRDSKREKEGCSAQTVQVCRCSMGGCTDRPAAERKLTSASALRSNRNHRACKGRKCPPLQIAHHLSEIVRQKLVHA